MNIRVGIDELYTNQFIIQNITHLNSSTHRIVSIDFFGRNVRSLFGVGHLVNELIPSREPSLMIGLMVCRLAVDD